jgi:hypothetical protein
LRSWRVCLIQRCEDVRCLVEISDEPDCGLHLIVL